MGTAGPSGFHSANTHMELCAKAVQIHRLGACGCTDRERKSRGGRASTSNEQMQQARQEKKTGRGEP